VLRERKPSLRRKSHSQPKVIRDLNPDFKVNPDSDTDLCRIVPKVLWIRYYVGVSHFAECRENRSMTVRENANKSPKIAYSAMVR